jgi:hypothetical protein
VENNQEITETTVSAVTTEEEIPKTLEERAIEAIIKGKNISSSQSKSILLNEIIRINKKQ